jgi:hypothetical protein
LANFKINVFLGRLSKIHVKNIDSQSSIEVLEAIEIDIKEFTQDSNELLKNHKNLKKMKKIKLLDNICFVTTTLLLVFSNTQNKELCLKLSHLRKNVIQIVKKLVENGFLVKSKITSLEDEILMDEFLTYSKYQKSNWTWHLIAGILMLFWDVKTEVR